MTVLINFLSATSGGALSYLRNIVPAMEEVLSETDGENTLVLLLTTHQMQLAGGQGKLNAIVLPDFGSTLSRLLWERRELPKLVGRLGITTLFTPYQLAPIIKGVTNVSMIRNMEPFLYSRYPYSLKNRLRNRLLRFLGARTLRKSDRVIACSDYSAEYCKKQLGVDEGRLTRIYHGRDTSFSPEQALEDPGILSGMGVHGKYVFSAGSMLPYRRCELVIDGFARSVNAPKLELLIAGSGTDVRYAKKIENLVKTTPGVKIRLLGQVSPEAMKVLYRNCLCFVTATEIEACPNIAIEAMSSGARIISSDSAPLPEMFGEAAHYFSAGAGVARLAELIDTMAVKANESNTTALQRAQLFSWRQCAQSTLDVLMKQELD